MSKKPGYKVNHVDKDIVITKDFHKAAGIRGSKEYLVMRTLRKENPGYNVKLKTVETSTSKVTYEGLTYEEMRKHIAMVRPDTLEQFELVKRIGKTRRGQYAFVKQWFLNNFKDYGKLQVPDIPEQLELPATTQADEAVNLQVSA